MKPLIIIAVCCLGFLSMHCKESDVREAELAQRPDTITTPTGLRYIVLKEGSGGVPDSGALALVHYTGYLTDSSIFDSSRDRDQPFAFRIGEGQVIQGWEEAFVILRVGTQARLIIPPHLGYGKRGRGDVIPPDATLIFDVELLEIHVNSLGMEIEKMIEFYGITGAQSRFTELKTQGMEGLYVSEAELNLLGYKFLQQGRTEEATEIFKMNVEMYPDSFNVYDSLGEAYLAQGDTVLAIANYNRSLELDSTNTNAVEVLTRIRSTGT